MSKFKVGDKVVRTEWDADYLMQGKPYCVVTDVDGQYIAVEGNRDGCAWDEAYFDLYQEPAQKTFNPKPGDIIVTEGEGNWVCVDKTHDRYSAYQDYDFIGVNNDGFTAWMANGTAYHGPNNPDPHIYDEFRIKEIIPASSNNPVAISQQPQDLSFRIKALELENQMLRMLLRRKGVDV